MGKGMLVTEGDENRQQRKVLGPAFSSEHVKLLVEQFWTKSCELTEILKGEEDVDGGYNVVPALARATLDIIGLAGTTLCRAFSNGRIRV